MDIFSVFTLCGGLAFFLYGMTVMSKSLEKMAGGKLERMLKRMTSNPFKSLLLGAGITSMIGLQVFINMGVVTGILPTTGLPLPFFSAGGTSVSMIMAAVGILLNISRTSGRALASS